MPHSNDIPVPDAIMNSQWKARNNGFQMAQLLYRQELSIWGVTAQSRVYGASAWETWFGLFQLIHATVHGQLTRRIYHPELAAVAPAAGTDPKIDSQIRQSQCTQCRVGSCKVAYQIVIDKSGSMKDPIRCRTSKKRLKCWLTCGFCGLFDHRGDCVQPKCYRGAAIDCHHKRGNKTTIKNKIDTITPGACTAIGDGAKKALNNMVLNGSLRIKIGLFICLTDGITTRGSNPVTVIPNYQADSIPMYTFAYGADADAALLQRLATDTGGKYYFSPTTFSISRMYSRMQISNITQCRNNYWRSNCTTYCHIKSKISWISEVFRLRYLTLGSFGCCGYLWRFSIWYVI